MNLPEASPNENLKGGETSRASADNQSSAAVTIGSVELE